ncbi:MAG: hypothetical protein ACR2GD_08985, partial [Pyrinomonadaceae bacterium]
MKNSILFLAIFVCLFSASQQISAQKRFVRKTAAQTPAKTIDQLPISRVSLYSNGMVYIERRGVVSGNAEINLSFKQSQVDDVLKSMVVLDLGQGKIGAVSYNSSVPAEARTAEIPFNIESSSDDETGG